ncbi:MAG: YidC/Oxa1 family membrane protein insertase [Oscillospiraceae bacterium]
MLYAIYHLICKNVGVAIILFTFIIKAALLPIYIKQQKTSAKTAIFAPKVREIQTKYKNNPQKQQDELAKLQQQGYKPTAGCLPTLLSFLILFGVIDVVYKPLTHIIHTNENQVSAMVEESYNIDMTSLFVKEINLSGEELSKLDEKGVQKHEEIIRDAKKIITYYNEHCLTDGKTAVDIADFKEITADNVKVMNTAIKRIISDEYAKDVNNAMLTNADIYKITDAEKKEIDAIESTEDKKAYREEHCFGDGTIALFNTLTNHYGYYKATGMDTVQFVASASLQRELYALECYGNHGELFSERVVNDDLREQINELSANLNFLGIPLGQVPMEHMGFPMILIPILSFLLALAQTFISMQNMKKSNPDAGKQMGCMNVMMYIMPFFSLWIAFSVPAGAGFYWAVSYVFGIIQTLILNKLYNPSQLREQALAEYELNNKVVTVEAVREKVIDEETGEVLTQKEINRRKLAEARKADALKYGEEYKEDDDDD